MQRIIAIGVAFMAVLGSASAPVGAVERQVTFSPKNHTLDNNDNFSPDGTLLCYDTRDTVGTGIENSQSIEIVHVTTGKETVLYAPPSRTGEDPAPGVGAVSFVPDGKRVVFIHGPLLDQAELYGPYDKRNRTGATVPIDGSGTVTWLDRRDIATDRPTLPGAHRGGTHRHEFTLDGKRVGFTYDDYLLQQYGRTIAYMEPNAKAPAGATDYLAILVPVVPEDQAKPGDLVKAAGDSWVGRHGLMRAFIGKVREADGSDLESLFVVDVPAAVDITTAFSGTADEFPRPPKGLTVRRLTHSWAGGIVRGTEDGDRIAYYGRAEDDSIQIFVIPSDGSDRDPDPAKRPVQATHLPDGAGPALRWHPSGNAIACISNGGVAVTCVKPGARFGETVFLTSQGDGAPRDALVWSPDGTRLAFDRPVPTKDATGEVVKNCAGHDFRQIFTIDYPDADGDGVFDAAGSASKG